MRYPKTEMRILIRTYMYIKLLRKFVVKVNKNQTKISIFVAKCHYLIEIYGISGRFFPRNLISNCFAIRESTRGKSRERKKRRRRISLEQCTFYDYDCLM